MWSVLYAIIAVSFGYVAYLYVTKAIPFAVFLPIVLNIIFNLAFTPLQFGLKSNLLAAVDILVVLGTLVWALWIIHPYAAWVSYVNIPYLLWVLFATVPQLTITYLNV